MSCPRRQFLTADQRDRRDEQHAELYDRLTAEVEAADRAEYEEQFGPTYKARFPYQANGPRIDERVCKMMRDMREDA